MRSFIPLTTTFCNDYILLMPLLRLLLFLFAEKYTTTRIMIMIKKIKRIMLITGCALIIAARDESDEVELLVGTVVVGLAEGSVIPPA